MTSEPRWRRRVLAPRTYQVVATIYLAGLVVWLLLGLLPAMSVMLPPLHDALRSLAGGSLAADADRSMLRQMDDMASASLGWVALNYLFSLLNLALGVLLVWKRPDEVVPRLLALAVMGTAATFNAPSHDVFHLLGSPPPVEAVHFTFHLVSGTAYLWAVALFPDGTLPVATRADPRLRRVAGLAVTAAVVLICWRSSFIAHPPFFVAFFGVLVPVVGIGAQSARLRTWSRGPGAAALSAHAAEQARLLRTALLPALVVALVWLGGHLLDLVGPEGFAGASAAAGAQAVFPAVFAVVPVVMFVAIVRHHLWDIDLVVSRALLIAVLLGSVSIVYVAAVAVTGVLLGSHGWAVVVPLAVVACVAEPVRQRAQSLCNRLVFGQELSPREAVRSLVDRFSGVGDTDELTELTRVIVQSSRAGAAALWLVDAGQLVRLARHPAGAAAADRVPLPATTLEGCRAALRPAAVWPVTYQGRLLAVLSVTTPRGVALTRRELRLLDDLSHHAGLLVANAKLTVDLAHELQVVQTRAADLRRAREELVRTQDRRRRALERDIHDGAQQQLVALLIMLRSLGRRAAKARTSAGVPGGRVDGSLEGALDGARSVLAATDDTLARLSGGAAPAVLVREGLEAALRDAAGTIGELGPAVRVQVDSPSLGSGELQTALYFCCLEALQNAVKHAAASRIDVLVRPAAGRVEFLVTDDGRGFDQQLAAGGSGLGNLGSRLVPFGGGVEVQSAPGRGTTVHGWAPLRDEPRPEEARDRPVGAPT